MNILSNKLFASILFIAISVLTINAKGNINSKHTENLPSTETFVEDNAFTQMKNDYALCAVDNGKEIFLQLKIVNDSLLRRAIFEGVTMYVDITGKKKETTAIKFPDGKPQRPQGERPKLQHGERPKLTQERLAQIVEDMAYRPIVLDIDGEAQQLLNENQCGIELKNGILYYSICIPYEILKGSTLNNKGKISFGFFTNGRKMRPRKSEGEEGHPRGFGGPRPGGMWGMGGGGYGAFSQMNPNADNRYKDWTTIQISK